MAAVSITTLRWKSVTDSTLSANEAVYGGGIYNDDSLNITKSDFIENDANFGGGIYNIATLEVTGCTFSANDAFSGGGGINNYNWGRLVLKDSTFSENESAYGGGIDNSGTLEATGCTFSANNALSRGGAINNDRSLDLSNSTIFANHAKEGGGIFTGDDGLTVNNSTFSGNSADNGGGIFSQAKITTVTNTIIVSSPSGGNCYGFFLEGSNNLTDLWPDTTFDLAHLGVLADNGGPTQTMALLATTPANPAINAAGTGATASDQRGATAIGTRDIGAYEAGASILTVVSTTPTAGAALENLNTIVVNFNEDALHNGTDKAANTADNYRVVEQGENRYFDTLSCADPGASSDDVRQTVSSVAYTNQGGAGPFAATLSLASPLKDGTYRLFICGTTSIWSAAGLELNNGLRDTTVDFTVGSLATVSSLPLTGFPQGRITALPAQPSAIAYAETALMLNIPDLGLHVPIVGVPRSGAGWDVTWLGRNAGYLAGSAFPTWAGNTVITAHVWDAYNQPGPFVDLKSLSYGDRVEIQAWGQTYVYEVRESKLVTRHNTTAVLVSEEYDWVTLLTCERYNPFTGEYLSRRMIRAVLVSVE